MDRINALREEMLESCKDMRLNLSSVLQGTVLTPQQTFATALAAAYFVGARSLAEALIADGSEHLGEAEIGDAQAAASLMGMNTVYYRTRHMLQKESYEHRRPSFRMSRMAAPPSGKVVFELCAMACAALAGCENCIKAHEASLLKEGLTEDHVHEAVRIAAVINGSAVALRLASQQP